MATTVWTGGAIATFQVNTYTFGGTWEATDVVNVTIGAAVKSIVAGSTTTATVVQNVLAALQSETSQEFLDITWSASTNDLIATSNFPGVPFTCTIATTETGGGAADGQTINGSASSTGTATVAASGPNFFNVAANWSNGVPVDAGTVIFENSNVDCLYGLANSAITPAEIRIESSYSGSIGLPQYNERGYREYRQRFLQLGNSADAQNTQVRVGYGPGAGSSRIYLDCGTGQATVNVVNTAPPVGTDTPSFCFLGTHVSNVVNVNRGSVGIAYDGGTSATVATLRVGYIDNPQGDSDVVCGPGATLTTIEQSGGNVLTRSNITTLNLYDGTFQRLLGTATNLNIDGGTYVERSGATATNVTVGPGGTVDCRQDMQARTYTNVSIHAGATFFDPAGTVTATNGYDFVRCSPHETTFEARPNRTWTDSAI